MNEIQASQAARLQRSIEGNDKVNEMARKKRIQESIRRYLLHLDIKKRLAIKRKGKGKDLFDPFRYELPRERSRRDTQ